MMSAQAQTPAIPAEAPPGLPQATTVAGLEAQAIELRVQLSGLRAQWDGLRTQLNEMLRNNPARPGVQQKWADVGVQIAQTEGDLARVEAQIAERTGARVGVGTRQPNAPRAGRRPFDPSVAFPVTAVLFLVMLLPMSVAWARRISRGAPRPAPLPAEHIARLERIEQAIDTVAIEVERISEGQRFVTKILAERPQRPHSATSEPPPSAEASPMRALGAGPVEPYRAPERQEVREEVRDDVRGAVRDRANSPN